MRQLASIQTISGFTPIEGADNIHLVHIMGWKVVARKTEFKVGDSCVFLEIDSLIPASLKQFEFLAKYGTKKLNEDGEIKEYYRIRSIKLRKALSQGLALPMSAFPELVGALEGRDVTAYLGIKHYDSESPLNAKNYEISKKTFGGRVLKFLFQFYVFRKLLLPFFQKERGAWPEFIQHTDEERIQSIGYAKLYEQYKEETFYVTEKIDYQSGTYFTRVIVRSYWKLFTRTKKIFSVCSRTQWKKTKDNSLWWKIAEKYKLEEVLNKSQEELTIQGEQGDTNVQGNKYGITEPQLWVFNLMNNRTGHHSDVHEMVRFCEYFGLQTVPILDTNFKLLPTIDEMLEYAKGFSVINPKVMREGVVVRLIKDGQKLVSFKIINNDFLLKHEDA